MVSFALAGVRKGAHTRCRAERLSGGQFVKAVGGEGFTGKTSPRESWSWSSREICLKELMGRYRRKIKWGSGCMYQMFFWRGEGAAEVGCVSPAFGYERLGSSVGEGGLFGGGLSTP